MMVDGIDLSALKILTSYKRKHANDRDVLEIFDEKIRETQQSFYHKPPPIHSNNRNSVDEAHQSFYDGSGRYSNQTHELVNVYLSVTPSYDSRKLEFLDQPDYKYRYNSINPINTHSEGLNSVLLKTKYSPRPTQSHPLSKSLSMAEMNNRIKSTINESKRAYMM
jgi:hypothetical protein